MWLEDEAYYMTLEATFFFSFSYFYDIETSTTTKTIVMHDGLLLCEEHKLYDIIIEYDFSCVS